MTVLVASAAVRQPCSQANSAIAEPSSWATFPKLNASRPCSPKRFGPIWSVPMHGAIASVPWEIASCTTGVAKSTSHVTKTMSAPPSSSVVAQTLARDGSLFCVSHVSICSSRPSTPPCWLIWSTRILAAASAGPSNGAICPDASCAQPIVIGPSAAGAPASSSSPPHPAVPSARAATNSAALHPILPRISPPLESTRCVLRFYTRCLLGLRIRGLPGFHERVERLVEGRRNGEPLPFANERAVDQLHLRRASRADVLEHRRMVRATPLRGVHVHLPGVIVHLDAGGVRHALALVDERVDELPEVALGEVEVVREAGERRDAVDGRVEDQLRPLRGPQVGERPRLQARGDDQARGLLRELGRRVAVRPQPGLRVEHVLHVRVRAARAAHEGHSGEQAPIAVAPDDL